MDNQYAFIKIKLSKLQYKRGYFYVSAITNEENKITSYDFRYFVDEDDNFIPTYNGVRLPFSLSDEFFFQIYRGSFIEEYCLNLTKDRSIYIRHLDDANGEFIDIRNYVKSEKYTGWTKQGIRLPLCDFEKLQNEIINFLDNKLSINDYQNLFESKVITSNSKSKKKTSKDNTNTSRINPELLKIINS